MIDTSLFPYENHPVRLEVLQENRIAWFKDDYDLQKYITRTKLKPKNIKVLYRDEKPTRTSKTDKKKLQQGTTKSSDGGTSRPRRNTKDLDAVGNVSRTRKPKPKSK
jgi:hypothetical protein